MNKQKIIDHIVDWLSTYCRQSGMNGFAVGVSGGIDSALTSALCAKTGTTVLAFNLPIYQAPEQVALSTAHIRWLETHFSNVKGVAVDLTSAFQALENTIPLDIQDGLTMANTRSRLRMLTLYAFASHHRLLVAGTGNKIEDFGVGFYTKYGDGGVDLSPIADLFKTEVYLLAEFLGIFEDILNAPPTDGLWDDKRTDESQLGASYAELEWAMTHESGAEMNPSLNDRQREVLAIYRRFRQANRHKMEPIPVCCIPDSLRKENAREI
ncbi:MAG: NAD(+) synthase [Desulfobacterales bacterium]|jgi:NAD+ synthase|nr:NAD(+) synthase [Desulfobacterales bacterium]